MVRPKVAPGVQGYAPALRDGPVDRGIEGAVSDERPAVPDTTAEDPDAGAVDLDGLRFGPDGLIPAVIVDASDDAVLMLAWMNRASLERSVASGRTVFWSRSRGELWQKGATSGHVQHIVDVRVDCDADALVITVDQAGVACHTGSRSCFHRGLTA
jgi:phosphoribosyl-AMP cyclohydrolase